MRLCSGVGVGEAREWFYAGGMTYIAEHYQSLLGLSPPWQVSEVVVRHETEEVEVVVEWRGERPACPECGAAGQRHDGRRRRWRHLDTMHYRTWLVAQLPRVRCAAHGVRQVSPPWAEEKSRFTARFEGLVIAWLLEASALAVGRQFGLSWGQVANIQRRAVRRGLARRELLAPRRMGVDETSFQKRHEYVTVVNDLEGRVLYVADGRSQTALDGFFEDLGSMGCARIGQVAMDMAQPYIQSVHKNTEAEIVFDKFHVFQHLGQAVDRVRREENRELARSGDDRLKNSKYLWQKKPGNLSRRQQLKFAALRASGLRVARAWAIKQMAGTLWGYRIRGWAERRWREWYSWAIRSRLEPIKRVARMIKRHWEGVINAATSTVTNARAEAINSRIQWLKKMACGYRNRTRFREAIYFHLGGLDLSPAAACFHTKP